MTDKTVTHDDKERIAKNARSKLEKAIDSMYWKLFTPVVDKIPQDNTDQEAIDKNLLNSYKPGELYSYTVLGKLHYLTGYSIAGIIGADSCFTCPETRVVLGGYKTGNQPSNGTMTQKTLVYIKV